MLPELAVRQESQCLVVLLGAGLLDGIGGVPDTLIVAPDGCTGSGLYKALMLDLEIGQAANEHLQTWFLIEFSFHLELENEFPGKTHAQRVLR